MKQVSLILLIPCFASCELLKNPGVQESALQLGLSALELAAQIEAQKRAEAELEMLREQEGFGGK